MSYPIYIYTLLLEDDYYYIGRTKDWERRKKEYFSQSGSAWTKLHPPVEVLSAETFLVNSQEEEDRWENHQTIKIMKEKGWQRVRGGFWCHYGEMETLLALHHHGYFTNINLEDATLQSREHTVYVLRLEEDKYYVGSSRSLKLAIERHEKGKNCDWTRKYPPIELIDQQMVTYENGIPNQDILNTLVIEYGEKYGYENVRGGNFNLLDNNKHLQHISTYIERERIGWNTSTNSKLLSKYKEKNRMPDCEIELRPGEALYYVYILALQGGFYHISCVRDVEKILLKIEKGKGGQWCTMHPPVKLEQIIPVIGFEKCPDIEQIDPIVEHYFNIYGAEKVRGGRFVSPEITAHMKKVYERYKVIDGVFIKRDKAERSHMKYERRKERQSLI